MVRPKQELVVAKKCHRCKLKQCGKCEGQLVMKGAELKDCNGFISDRSNTIIQANHKVPFPVKERSVNWPVFAS